ncbi:hypothetical protein VTL71DRAFT_4533 [Oculimacula yallundae]|uniref:Uncharacterized protein n=1 Tax=Oculimacula yallundae TaxID=86028 RepID=A0ABR4C3Y1_9HELO
MRLDHVELSKPDQHQNFWSQFLKDHSNVSRIAFQRGYRVKVIATIPGGFLPDFPQVNTHLPPAPSLFSFSPAPTRFCFRTTSRQLHSYNNIITYSLQRNCVFSAHDYTPFSNFWKSDQTEHPQSLATDPFTMSANDGTPRMPDWVTQDQLDEMKRINAEMKRSGPAQRPGRSAPSTRGSGRSPGMTSAHSMSSPNNTYNSAPIRPARAPGTTRSGGLHPHWGGGTNYSVGPSTPAPTFKPSPREKPASPIRGSATGPMSIPVKQKSPPKLRSSILVAGQSQPVLPLGNAPMLGGQSTFGQPSFGQDEPIRHPDRRFNAAESFPPMAQQPGSSYGMDGETTAAIEFVPSTPAPAAPPGDGSASTLPPPTGQRIETNWTDDDPKKPIIPGHLRQVASIAIAEVAALGGWTVPEISSDGYSIGGGTATLARLSGMQDSIYAPGNAGANRGFLQNQPDLSNRALKPALINAQRSAATITYKDGDVEMSDGPSITQPSAPQGPVDWDNMPKLSSSKYATAPSFSTKITAPKPTPVHENKENVKPAPHAQVTKDFSDIAKNIVAKIAKSSASNNVGGFVAAAQNVKTNPFPVNGTHDSQNPNSKVFGAPWGSIDQFAPKSQTGFDALQSAAPTSNPWGSVNHSVSNGQTGAGAARPAVVTSNAWGSVDYSATNGQTGFCGSQPLASAGHTWGSIDHSASNGQNGFGGAQPVAAAGNTWGSANHATSNNIGVQAGYMATSSAAHSQPTANAIGGWGPIGQSATNVQPNQGGPSPIGFGASQTTSNLQAGGSAAFQPVNSGQAYLNPFMANVAVSAASQPAQNQVNTNLWGAAATNNLQPKKVPGKSGVDISSIIGNIANDIRGMVQGNVAAAKPTSYQPASTGQQAVRPHVAPNAFNGQQTGPTQHPRYQVVPETKKPAGLADFRWA